MPGVDEARVEHGRIVLPQPELPLPEHQTEESIQQFFASIGLENAPAQELEGYWRQDWRRFLYTYGLVRPLAGRCLELGSNPYFTTMLLKHFTPLDITSANYFGPGFGDEATQRLTLREPASGETASCEISFYHFNIEQDRFPFDSQTFDVVLFCEILEHLQLDPVGVLHEITRVLKPGGTLVLTTPNVSRLDNVCRMIAGENIYDPYSGYGAYGRHNREYNKHDLARVLTFCGFEVEVLFSADVHDNNAGSFAPLEKVFPLVSRRAHDLGQYLFSRSTNARPPRQRRPAWLYRSYPPDQLE